MLARPASELMITLRSGFIGTTSMPERAAHAARFSFTVITTECPRRRSW
ncbi:hypothetical protein ND450_06900 [Lentzea sp. HUAS12]|nr:hypothetical protein [Lentzea sp. HUAS12]USX53829.1 hypothetical protein ND450_06900 [Lentzea sp. HUAS12]